MFVLKLYRDEENVFEDPDDSIEYMIKTKFSNSVHVYDISTKDAYSKTRKIYEAIKEYNKGKPLDNQILPSNPYSYRGILGCLGVQVYEITLGTYKRNHGCISLFTGFNESVLDTTVEHAHVIPGKSNIIYECNV